MRVVALVLAAMTGIEMTLDRRAIDDALAIASSTIEVTHGRYHADYLFTLNAAPIDFISIVTPFRRVVLSAETEHKLGRRAFGRQEAAAALQPDPRRLEIYVELTFHPFNTFVGVPDYTVAVEPLSPSGEIVVPLGIDRVPRYGPRIGTPRYPFPYPVSTAPRIRSGTEPLSGGTLIAGVAGDQLNPNGQYAVIVKDGPKELGRVRVDFARLR